MSYHPPWTSKLGHDEDIEHRTFDALMGAEYGTVVRVMRRTLPQADSLDDAD
jgi:hypothetical protein